MVEMQAVLGMHVAAGVAHLALVHKPAVHDLAALAKMEPAANVDPWTGLRQFGERLVADARSFGVVCLAIAETRKYDKWGYRDAYGRASLEVAAGLATCGAGIEVRIVVQRTAATSLAIDETEIPKQVAEHLGVVPVRGDHWKERAPAFLVALHVARQLWP
ncbi:MAG TPA: hypothetical protein VFT22_27600 [Kofleriaceae bacterium]|nr:hypothetical protein [Kofleriaceae bacterium]